MTDINPFVLPEGLKDEALLRLSKLGDRVQELRVERVVFGLFFTGVILSNNTCGLAATPIKEIPFAVCCPSSARAFSMSGKLAGKAALDVLRDISHPQALRRTLALATLNALAETLLQRDGLGQRESLTEGDSFDSVRIRGDDKVVLVGAFGPYIKALRKSAQDFRILEYDTSTLHPDELQFYVPVESAYDALVWADVVIATGTTLLNGSLTGLLSHVRPHAEIALIGPSVPLLSHTLTQVGVTLLGGVRVLDPHGCLDLLAEGASGYHLFERSVKRVNLRLNNQ